jgi:hypothetical protein
MRKIILIMVTLVFVLLLATPALAGKEKDTRTIGWGDSIIVSVPIDGSTNVMYDVKVDSGPNVNVWWLEQIDYDKYVADQPFEYYILYSNEDVRSIKEDFTWSQDGTHYVVIDTMGIADLDENATVSYSVEWREPSASDWFMNIGICIAIIVVVFVVLFVIYRIRSRDDMPPPVPAGSAYAPEYPQYPSTAPPEMTPSDQGPGYVPPEPTHQPPQGEPPAYDPAPRQDPPQY